MARTVIVCVAAASRSMAPATVTTPVAGVDGEASAGIVGERVGHGAGGGIAVGGEGGNADGGADGGILVDGIGRGIAVAQRRDVELVDVGHGDGEGLGRAGAVLGGRRHADRDRGLALAVEAGAGGNAHLTGDRIDHEAAAGIVCQAVGHAIGGGIAIGCEGGDAYLGSGCRVLGNAFAAASVSVGG